jgi:hypothetical protein
VGHVSIEAVSAEEAISIAHDLYNCTGKELPDMDDCENQRFEVVPK